MEASRQEASKRCQLVASRPEVERVVARLEAMAVLIFEVTDMDFSIFSEAIYNKSWELIALVLTR